MTARAVLFDLGNTLVSYYAAADFPPILRACLRACVATIRAGMLSEHSEQAFARCCCPMTPWKAF